MKSIITLNNLKSTQTEYVSVMQSNNTLAVSR